MHSSRIFLFALIAFSLPLSAATLTNQDIIKMHQAGLNDDVILLAIKPGETTFDTSADALIALKAAGISDTVIQKMLAPTAPVAVVSDDSAAEPVASVFTQDFPSIAPAFVTPVVGENYYTRFTFHEEGDEYVTTNYARGAVVPINTPVQLVSMSRSKLVIMRSDTGQSIKVVNQEKYSKKSVAEIARLLLSAEKTPLEKLPGEVANAVRTGEMRKGMTKELVLMTRGYPPAHETASTESDRWVYWSSRFVKLTIVFSGGRLTDGRGLR